MQFKTGRVEELRNRLGLLDEPPKPEGDKNAGVLILLHDDGLDVKTLLCVRSANLRRHPGEVCFPGGMMDDDDAQNVRTTAIREAYEEVGIEEQDFTILGNLPAFRARFGIMIHPTIALLRKPLKITMNTDEVESVFWLSLTRFLSDQHHSSFPMDPVYWVHLFQFGDAPTTYGITALLCIVTAIGVFGHRPQFQIVGNLSQHDMQNLDTRQIIRHVYCNMTNFQKSKL